MISNHSIEINFWITSSNCCSNWRCCLLDIRNHYTRFSLSTNWMESRPRFNLWSCFKIQEIISIDQIYFNWWVLDGWFENTLPYQLTLAIDICLPWGVWRYEYNSMWWYWLASTRQRQDHVWWQNIYSWINCWFILI